MRSGLYIILIKNDQINLIRRFVIRSVFIGLYRDGQRLYLERNLLYNMSQTISAQLDDETLRNFARINPENRTEAIRVAAKGYLDGLDQDTPSWYFKQGGIEPETVYRFLRSIRHSKDVGRYAKGIYKKADDRTKTYIEEMCDPESPIYVEEIAESLKDQIELHSIQKEIEASRNALNKLKSEVTERTEEAEELAKKCDVNWETENRRNHIYCPNHICQAK